MLIRFGELRGTAGPVIDLCWSVMSGPLHYVMMASDVSDDSGQNYVALVKQERDAT